MAFANHQALSCHCYGASSIHGTFPIRSLQTTGLLALSGHKNRSLPAQIISFSGKGVSKRRDETNICIPKEKLRWQASLQVNQGKELVYNTKLGWQTLGLATTWWFGNQAMSIEYANAVEDSVTITESVTKHAPEWVAPVVLGVPVAYYVLFTLYRSKVNPYAKLTDWVFGLVALAILGNLVLIATVGVRLY